MLWSQCFPSLQFIPENLPDRRNLLRGERKLTLCTLWGHLTNWVYDTAGATRTSGHNTTGSHVLSMCAVSNLFRWAFKRWRPAKSILDVKLPEESTFCQQSFRTVSLFCRRKLTDTSVSSLGWSCLDQCKSLSVRRLCLPDVTSDRNTKRTKNFSFFALTQRQK